MLNYFILFEFETFYFCMQNIKLSWGKQRKRLRKARFVHWWTIYCILCMLNFLYTQEAIFLSNSRITQKHVASWFFVNRNSNREYAAHARVTDRRLLHTQYRAEKRDWHRRIRKTPSIVFVLRSFYSSVADLKTDPAGSGQQNKKRPYLFARYYQICQV